MSVKSAILAFYMALLANAIPHGHQHAHHHEARQATGSTFNINLQNNCSAGYTFEVVTRPGGGTCTQVAGQTAYVASGSSYTFQAPFLDVGGRMGTGDACGATALFEFGYAKDNNTGAEGTFYDVSLIADPDNVGIGIYPSNSACATKVCQSQTNCPVSQGWTNPDQLNLGSPANTGCYVGPVDFTVVWCPGGSSGGPAPATTLPVGQTTTTTGQTTATTGQTTTTTGQTTTTTFTTNPNWHYYTATGNPW